MQDLESKEAHLVETNHLLIAPSALKDHEWIQDFFGSVLWIDDLAAGLPRLPQKTVYLCGDVSRLGKDQLDAAARVLVVRQFSTGYEQDDGKSWKLVDMGRLPLRVQGVGVYFRRFFDGDIDHFHRICTEHTFQSLTESTKPGKAHRKGVYLTPVQQHGEELHFRLLRCSTNLAGPTESFRETDKGIVEALNHESGFLFQNQAPLNHVLAQVYSNTPADAQQKQSKARISAHADKTKDMPVQGIMAFCTFYDQLEKLSPLTKDAFDYGYKGKSGLARLHFRLKDAAREIHGGSLASQFTLTLYPDSVFFMPLSTNRLYTHEIQPSMLDAGMLPTRLGYVVRCSSTEAVHKNGDTYLKKNGQLVQLAPPTLEGMTELRKLYAQENRSTAFIEYGDQFPFSMNTGDYLAPQV